MRPAQLCLDIAPPLFTEERARLWWSDLCALLVQVAGHEPATAEVVARHLAGQGCSAAEASATRRAHMLGGSAPIPLELLEELGAHLIRGAMQLPAEVNQ